MIAARELPNALHDRLAVVKEFVPDDRVTGEYDEAALGVDLGRMGIARVGRAHDLGPVVSDDLFGGVSSHLVLL